MGIWSYLGEPDKVQETIDLQKASKKNITHLSVHLLLFSYVNCFTSHCHGDMSQFEALFGGHTLTSAIHEIYLSLSKYRVSPVRLTHELIINAGAIVASMEAFDAVDKGELDVNSPYSSSPLAKRDPCEIWIDNSPNCQFILSQFRLLHEMQHQRRSLSFLSSLSLSFSMRSGDTELS